MPAANERRASSADDAQLATAMLGASVAVGRFFLMRLAIRDDRAATERIDLALAERELRREVENVVCLCRLRDEPPEKVLIRLKELFTSLPEHGQDIVDSVRQQVIRWAIEDYYRGR
jgi:hypothetical protein